LTSLIPQAQLEKAKAGRFDFDDYLTQAKMVFRRRGSVLYMLPSAS